MARAGRIRKTPEMQAGIDAVLSDARHSLSMRAKLLEQRRVVTSWWRGG
jgi:hypothetical protein